MKSKVKNQAITCCALLALGLIVGATSLHADTMASANETTTSTVEMLVGARIKFNDEKPSLKFEGVIDGYDAEATTKYGMLIMPETTYLANTFDNDYHTVLDSNDVYEDKECAPYAADDKMQIAAYAEIAESDYTTRYIAIGYSVNGGEYSYADVNIIENARSVSYVAQMSLLYDTLTEEVQTKLQGYVDAAYTLVADYDAEQDNYNEKEIVVGNGISVCETDYVVAIDYSETREGYHTFQTTDKYSNITEISFDAYVPADSLNKWWGIAFTVNTEKDCYADATVTANLQNYVIRDTWVTYKYTTTDGVNWTVQYGKKGGTLETAYTAASATNTFNIPAYIFMTSAPTGIGQEGTKLKLDNFQWIANGETYADNFNTGASTLFTERADDGCDPVTFVQVAEGGIQIGATPAAGEDDYAAVLDFSTYQDGHKGFTTKNAYSNITQVKLDVYIPTTNAGNHWWGIAPVASNSGDAYVGSDATAGTQNLKNILVDYYGWTGRWVTLTYTVSGTSWTLSVARAGIEESHGSYTFDFAGGQYQSGGASYLFVSARPGASNWGVKLDNVSITADGKTYVDNFNTGSTVLFEAYEASTISYEALYLAPIPSFESVLENGTLADTLKNSESVISINMGNAKNWKDLASGALRLEVSLTYSITGDKGIIIALGLTEEQELSFLYVSEDKVAFYVGNTCQKEVELQSAANTLRISVLANGEVLLKVNDGEYVGMGVCSDLSGFLIADIEGKGAFAIEKIVVNAYNVNK